MKKMVLVAMIALSSLFAADFEWAKSYENAKQIAAKENKLVFVMFSQETCRMCNYMKEKVFEDEDLANFIALHFVPVDIDINKEKIPEGFRVMGTPTFYIVKPDGEHVGRAIIGGAKAKPFMHRLESYLKR
ncbi:thioredoxin family protein [Hydrogenimonas urashimensis]|uniref:thioredoxin family protein n=1 Tax=Hydrogenimonas urashimensis TaxID=2740515 RepID=UPI001916B1FC|nr:thioredoxin family protein [Hydrogenimonas urashimensis]